MYGGWVSPVPDCHSQGLSCPACVFQTLLEGLEEKDWFIGAEVQNNRPKLNIHYPIFRGAITNWDNVQKVSYTLGAGGQLCHSYWPWH